MSLDPDIRRCQHLKVNGTQCGSPALARHRFCFFHQRWRDASIKLSAGRPRSTPSFELPVLEDANSIQVALMQVVGMILSGELEAKRAGLLLYALQTASANLHAANFEPRVRQVVVHQEWVKDTPLGEDQFQETADYDEEDEDAEEADEAAEADEVVEAAEADTEEEVEAEEVEAAPAEAASDPVAAEAAALTESATSEEATEPETPPPPTLAEARAEIKKRVLAAYPEIVGSLKNLKACASTGTARTASACWTRPDALRWEEPRDAAFDVRAPSGAKDAAYASGFRNSTPKQ